MPLPVYVQDPFLELSGKKILIPQNYEIKINQTVKKWQ